MSYGFRVENASGQVVVSDETYNLVYLGKATYGGITYTFTTAVDILPSTFKIRELVYTIDSGGQPIVPFLYNPNSGGNNNRNAFGGIANLELSGNVWTIYVYMNNHSPFTVPTVYCFRKITSATLTGYGMAIFDSAGNQTFNTNANHINLKAIIDAGYGSPGISCGNFDGYFYCRCDTSDTITNAPSITYSKPAMTYSTQFSATGNEGNTGRLYFFDNLAYYNTVTNRIHTRWGFLANPGTASRYSFSAGSGSITTLIIDGAEYD